MRRAMSHLPHLKGPPAQPETLYHDYCGFYHDYPHVKKSHIWAMRSPFQCLCFILWLVRRLLWLRFRCLFAARDNRGKSCNRAWTRNRSKWFRYYDYIMIPTVIANAGRLPVPRAHLGPHLHPPLRTIPCIHADAPALLPVLFLILTLCLPLILFASHPIPLRSSIPCRHNL